MSIPTFQNLQTAYRALAASQTAISTTGHNISNANTEGYTRQRVDTAAISSSFKSKYVVATKSPGLGVEVTNISQIRDKFLDNRFRSENSDTNKYATILSGMGDMSNVFDEIENEGLQAQLIDFVNQLQTFSNTPTSGDLALVARTSAEQITQMLNLYAEEVQDVRDQLVYDAKNVVVDTDFNSIVQNVASLNKEIREQQLYGNTPNELLDQRNLLIDELSGIANIKVGYSTEQVTKDIALEKLTISLYDASTGTSIGLVDGSKYNILSVKDDGENLSIGINTSFTLPETPDTVNSDDITGYFTSGSLKGYIDFVNGKGTYADVLAGDNSFRGVAYYKEALDTFAREFSGRFNELNDTDATNTDPMALFTTDDGETSTGITALNIAISNKWLDDSTYITTTTNPSPTATGGNDNVLRMIELLSNDNDFNAKNGTTMFNGTFSEYLTSVGGELALDSQLYQNFHDTSSDVLADIANSKEETSGVSLDEEGVNLTAFQKAYNAAARYFTVLDEALDTLLGMGVVGR